MRTQFPKHLTALVNELRLIDSHGVASLIAKSDVGDRLTKFHRGDKVKGIKTPPPAWSNGLYCLTRSIVNVNHVYEKAVKNQIVKNGLDPAAFEVEESKVSRPVDGWPNTLLREGLNDPDQLYVRVFIEMGIKTTLETFYFNGAGQDVTHLITDDFRENFMEKKYGSVKQMVAGAAKEIKPREYKAENIIYFQKGSVVFNQLSNDLMTLFGLEAVSA